MLRPWTEAGVTREPSKSELEARAEGSTAAWLAMLGAIVLLFIADVLFAPHDRVLSRAGTDVWRQFAGWRAFGFGLWKSGDFPLWNPLVYGGMPYFTGFQSALLYPPNALFLAVPLTWAINWTIAAHAWWLAAGVFVWLRRSGLHPAAAAFAGLVAVFGGPHFLHLHAGHLTNLCVMAWVPWLFLVIEAWRFDGRSRWVAAGAAIVAMEVLAGHPQYVYDSGLAAGLVAIAAATRAGKSRRATFLLGVVAMFLGGALLAAVQLLPGFAALADFVRAGGSDEVFAGSYSLPPESLLTAVVPGFLGDGVRADYWGRWFYWESCAYVGVAAAALMGLGAWRGADRAGARRDVVVLFALVVLALGAYTPLFHVLFRVVPGYGLFRGSSKFLFFAALLAARLAGRGADVALRGGWEVGGRRMQIALGTPVAGTVGLAVVAGSLLLAGAPGGGPSWWSRWREGLWDSRQVTHMPAEQFFHPEFVREATQAAGGGLLFAAAITSAAIALLAASRRRRAGAWALLALGAAELLIFAAGFRQTFSLAELISPGAVAYRRAHPGDFRVLDRARANGGLLSGLPDVWGDDPGVVRRYAEFVAATQGLPPDAAAQTLRIRGAHARWDLLRFRAAFAPKAEHDVDVQEIDLHPLRRFEIVPQWEVRTGRDAVLARVLGTGFDPRRTVILETAPAGVAVDSSAGGEWTILRESADDVDVRVDAPRGGILLMTDPFSQGWRAEGLQDHQRYPVMPADWAFRAIPLPPGTHELRIFYRPPALRLGIALSGVAWSGLLAAALRIGLRRRAAHG